MKLNVTFMVLFIFQQFKPFLSPTDSVATFIVYGSKLLKRDYNDKLRRSSKSKSKV